MGINESINVYFKKNAIQKSKRHRHNRYNIFKTPLKIYKSGYRNSNRNRNSNSNRNCKTRRKVISTF